MQNVIIFNIIMALWGNNRGFFKRIDKFIVAAIVSYFILIMGINLYHFSLETMAYSAFKSESSLRYYSYGQKTYDVLKKVKTGILR